jgi:hypothetical protein
MFSLKKFADLTQNTANLYKHMDVIIGFKKKTPFFRRQLAKNAVNWRKFAKLAIIREKFAKNWPKFAIIGKKSRKFAKIIENYGKLA